MSGFTIAAAALARAVKDASVVTDRKVTIPILAMVKVHVEDGDLAVSGTDLDIEIQVSAKPTLSPGPGEVIAFCVSPFALLAAIDRLPKDWPVEVSFADGVVCVGWGWGKLTLNTLPAADFPVMVVKSCDHGFDIGEGEAKAIDKVTPCISSEETRYYLNGIFLDVDTKTENIRLVATDGHRLASVGTSWPAPNKDLKVIAPRRFVGVWRRLLGRVAHRLAYCETHIVVVSADIVIRSKVIDGKFPEWRRVVPKDERPSMTISRQALLNAVASAGRFIKAAARQRSLSGTLCAQDGQAFLDAKAIDAGDIHFDLGASRGADLWFGADMRYLASAAGAIDADEIKISTTDHGSPVTIEAADGKSEDVFVVMPLRTQEPSKRVKRQEQARAA